MQSIKVIQCRKATILSRVTCGVSSIGHVVVGNFQPGLAASISSSFITINECMQSCMSYQPVDIIVSVISIGQVSLKANHAVMQSSWRVCPSDGSGVSRRGLGSSWRLRLTVLRRSTLLLGGHDLVPKCNVCLITAICCIRVFPAWRCWGLSL